MGRFRSSLHIFMYFCIMTNKFVRQVWQDNTKPSLVAKHRVVLPQLLMHLAVRHTGQKLKLDLNANWQLRESLVSLYQFYPGHRRMVPVQNAALNMHIMHHTLWPASTNKFNTKIFFMLWILNIYFCDILKKQHWIVKFLLPFEDQTLQANWTQWTFFSWTSSSWYNS